MSAQSNTELVLRGLHIALSKAEPYAKEPSKVIVDKQQVLDLLTQLNTCMYQMMEEYELTKRGRDKAEREFRKRADQIIMDANHKAEDIYAASIMYMDEALGGLQSIMLDANDSVNKIYQNFQHKMKVETTQIRTNQSELKSQMQNLIDTNKYLNLIEERNREIEKQKTEGQPKAAKEPSVYANRRTEIKVNQEYLEKLGLSADNVPAEKPAKEESRAAEEKPEIKVNLDADYFEWKSMKDKDLKQIDIRESSKKQENSEGFHKLWKNRKGDK